MGSLFAMLVALITTVEALPYIAVIVALVVGFRLWIRHEERQDELAAERRRQAAIRAAAADAAERALLGRMWDQHNAHQRGEHIVTRINEHYYLCGCGAAGSERWALLHEYPVAR